MQVEATSDFIYEDTRIIECVCVCACACVRAWVRGCMCLCE